MPDINEQGTEGGLPQGGTDEAAAGPQEPTPVVLEGIVNDHGTLRTRPTSEHGTLSI